MVRRGAAGQLPSQTAASWGFKKQAGMHTGTMNAASTVQTQLHTSGSSSRIALASTTHYITRQCAVCTIPRHSPAHLWLALVVVAALVVGAVAHEVGVGAVHEAWIVLNETTFFRVRIHEKDIC